MNGLLSVAYIPSSFGEIEMSLNFDTTNIANRETVTTSPFDKDKWHPVTEAMIWACLAVEIGEITEANAEEYFERLAMWQLAFGPWLTFGNDEVYLTLEDVKLHIGLKTNVFPKKTKTQFLDKLGEAMKREIHTVKNRDKLSAHKLAEYKAHPELENIGSVAS